MRKSLDQLKTDRRGVIMLESLIVVTITVFLLFFILAVFSVLFQRFNIQIIANETATRLAQTYGYALSSDVVTGEVELDDIADVNPYRYFDETNLKLSTRTKASEYGLARLKKTTFTIDTTEPQINATITPHALGRRHITVEITGGFIVPFGDTLDYFGFNSVTSYTVHAYADCIDLLNYVNTVDTLKYWSSLSFLDSEAVDFINSIIRLFDDFAG